ncbi:conserved membrane hypothetical protein [Cupriavidus taiwanensis]|uniref:hypothetical protein n=1 Tax=Cupriavidus taiwanensis TaxID=164546 RepID=UPI000E186B3E|nr:hypothetical protein [Cupriavidus taiwanensis]SOZ14651.1 conserved membrane hypothetical protein [Cupriavidus taiwanensis]SOZ26361.1 conserved membrane hypothetical protein [Cupriavidus taiwanensis]SOZ45225.1 conserved membrane hypothetical protein [Cupriavidus taiwanensis]
MRMQITSWMCVLTALLIALGASFLIYVVFFAQISLDEVRTGRLVAIGGVTVVAGALLMLLEIGLTIFVLFRRPGIRLRAVASMLVGTMLFVGCYVAADSWIVHKLPHFNTPAQFAP